METVTIFKTSPFTGKRNSMTLTLDQKDLDKWWKGGMLIQHALPYLTPDEREFLITGLLPEEWKKVMERLDADD